MPYGPTALRALPVTAVTTLRMYRYTLPVRSALQYTLRDNTLPVVYYMDIRVPLPVCDLVVYSTVGASCLYYRR